MIHEYQLSVFYLFIYLFAMLKDSLPGSCTHLGKPAPLSVILKSLKAFLKNKLTQS
jgi:hypothetical protein